jgi:hypothetical protein
MSLMKVVILYRPKSEHARAVEMFVHDFQRRHGTTRLELVNVDEREGIAMVSLYDITSYPAFLVLANDGVLLQLWQGEQLPLMDEVASYFVRNQ